MYETVPPEQARYEENYGRCVALVAAFLRHDEEGLVALTGSDASVLLPMMVRLYVDSITQIFGRDELVRQTNEWFDRLPAGFGQSNGEVA